MGNKKVMYHYTALYHLPKIMSDGYLKLTESNLRLDVEMYKPVVWLTDLERPTKEDLALDGSRLDKTEVRVHVKKKVTFKTWETFANKNKMNKELKQIFASGHSPKNWFISTNPIYLKDILLIENTHTGEVYYKTNGENAKK
mgnify:CR=1